MREIYDLPFFFIILLEKLPSYLEPSFLKLIVFYTTLLLFSGALIIGAIGLLKGKRWGYRLLFVITLFQIPTVFIKNILAYNISTAFVFAIGYSFDIGIKFNLDLFNVGLFIATKSTPYSMFMIDFSAIVILIYLFTRLKSQD